MQNNENYFWAKMVDSAVKYAVEGVQKSGLIAILIAAFSSGALAQPSDRASWEFKNNRGNRFEGPVSEKVGAEFKIMGFWGYYEPYALHQKQALKVRFYADTATGSAFILARSKDTKYFYWMEAKQPLTVSKGWNEFGGWPVDEVLAQMAIPADQLSVLVYGRENEGAYLLPAFVYHSTPPTALSNYTFFFWPNKTYKRVAVKVYKGMKTGGKPIFTTALGKQFGGTTFAVDIPVANLAVEKDWAGPLTLELRLTPVTGSLKDVYTYHFFHQPSVR